ncbi:MAG: methyltetrahydrofolate cobalamin methyltransferase [Deltaproteobacteria bacterium]|nr:methyltetrahydrofolate cobalamin methyltransferase [Deltaproteobacteria bacterium]
MKRWRVLVIGENINSSIKEVEAAILQRNGSYIKDLARRQKDAGADYLEVNSGLRLYPQEEAEDLEWLVPLIQEETGLPICIDSAHALVHQAALRHHQGRAILNSINGDMESWKEILPLAKEHGCGIIALLSDRQGIPGAAAGRVKIAEKIIQGISHYGLSPEILYLDLLVMPISVNTGNGLVVLETLKELKRSFPQVKTVAALSNISYGLPRRRLLNQAFVIMALEAGLDAAIINPLDQRLMALMKAAQALLNRDAFCMNYIQAFRQGRLG